MQVLTHTHSPTHTPIHLFTYSLTHCIFYSRTAGRLPANSDPNPNSNPDPNRELLAEYHLHYCTSSDFDSVLFLATLEGHRQIKEQLVSGGSTEEGGCGSYDIIKKSSGGGAGSGVAYSRSNSSHQLKKVSISAY